MAGRAPEARNAFIQGLLLHEKHKQRERVQCLVLLSTKRACRVRGGLLPGRRPGGTRHVCTLGTPGCGRMQRSPRSAGTRRRWCLLLELSLRSVEGGAPSRRTWGKVEGMGTVRSAARRAEEQEGAPGLGSGSVRLLGAVAARSSLLCLVLTAGVGGPHTRAGSPYLYCSKYWVTHSPSEAQGRWKLRSQPVSAQVMKAPLLPQTKQCWKE